MSETCDDIHVRTKVDDILDVLWTVGLLLSVGSPAILALILHLLGKLD